MILLLQGALDDFTWQSIIGPLTGQVVDSSNATPWLYLENAYLWGSVPLVLGCLIVGIGATRPWMSRRVLWIITGLVIVGLILWGSTAIDGSPTRTVVLSRLTWAPALDGQIMQPLFAAAVVTLFVFLGTPVFLFARRRGLISRTENKHDSLNEAQFIFLTAIGCLSLVQLFPTADPNHLWWAAPVPLLVTALIATRFIPAHGRAAVLAVLIVPSIALATVTSLKYHDIERFEINDGVLRGMQIKQEFRAGYEVLDEILADPEFAVSRFECAHGLFPVWSGRYQADSGAHVVWSFGVHESRYDAPAERVMRCFDPDTPDAEIPDSLEGGFVRSRGIDDAAISELSGGRLVEYLAPPDTTREVS